MLVQTRSEPPALVQDRLCTSSDAPLCGHQRSSAPAVELQAVLSARPDPYFPKPARPRNGLCPFSPGATSPEREKRPLHRTSPTSATAGREPRPGFSLGVEEACSEHAGDEGKAQHPGCLSAPQGSVFPLKWPGGQVLLTAFPCSVVEPSTHPNQNHSEHLSTLRLNLQEFSLHTDLQQTWEI